jgi:hypothetical protein
MKRILVVMLCGLFAVVIASAGKKPAKPVVPPTEEQMRNAYAAGVRQLTALAKNPTTLRVDPIEKAWFRLGSSKRGDWVEMWLVFDGQNSFGAMIRSTGMCSLWLHGSDILGNRVTCLSSSNDFIALGMIPQGMVQIASKKSPPTPVSATANPALEQLAANSEAARASPAAAAGLASVGHEQSQQELADLVQKGLASRCAVVTAPSGAEVYVDGNKAGVSPLAFVLLKQGDTPRKVTIKMTGYKTVEKAVVPDGKAIPISVTLEKQ